MKKDILKEGYEKKEDPAITLKKLFDDETNGVVRGRAWAWVGYKDKRGQRYGSFKVIDEACLDGREYILNRSGIMPWPINILFIDEVYKVGKQMRSLLVKEVA